MGVAMHPSELATTHVRRAAARAVLTAALLLGALGVFSSPAQALQPGCTQSGPTVTCTYSSSSDAGMTTQFTVPSGISSLHVLAVGSAGGGNVDLSGKDPTCSPLCGGRADRVTADLAVSSGQVLGVDVAGDPNSNTGGTNGFGNGGGGGCNGGGGASGVADSFFSVFSLVAAGGGGEGCNGSGAFTNDPTTAGGDAGVAGSSGLNSSQDGGGGAAGTTTGGGAAGAPSSGSFPANGGTLQNGGGGGSGLTSGSNVGGPGGGG